MKYFKIILLSLFVIGMLTPIAKAQSEITFNLNLKPQLEDSTFIPGRDRVRIVGDLHPLITATPYYLEDESPKDSVYSITVRFSSRYRGQTLNYNFEMTSNYRKLTEELPRSILLQGREIKLDALYFNAFAW